MSSEQVNAIATLYETSIAATIKLAESIDPEKRMTQAKDEKSHPTWLLGHLALVFGFVGSGVVFGKENHVPNEYFTFFAPPFMGGQSISSDASFYPSWDELLETYKKMGEEFVSAVRELNDSDLEGSTRGEVPEPLKERFTNLGASVNFLVIHNAYHTGQMALLAAL